MQHVRDWLAENQSRYSPQATERQPRTGWQYWAGRFSERQILILEKAAARGFLFDPDPDLVDFRDMRGLGTMLRGCWDDGLPLVGVGAERERWEKSLRDLGLNLPRRLSTRASVFERVGPPPHFPPWCEYCLGVLRRPVVIAGAFTARHFAPDLGDWPHLLGVVVTLSAPLGSTYATVQASTWDRLLTLAHKATLSLHSTSPFPGSGRLRFDGDLLAVEVRRDDAEELATSFSDVLEEDGYQIKQAEIPVMA